MKFKVTYEIRTKREVIVEAKSAEEAQTLVHDGKVGGEVDVADVEWPDIVSCEVVQ
jgi:hypothetical protein